MVADATRNHKFAMIFTSKFDALYAQESDGSYRRKLTSSTGKPSTKALEPHAKWAISLSSCSDALLCDSSLYELHLDYSLCDEMRTSQTGCGHEAMPAA